MKNKYGKFLSILVAVIIVIIIAVIGYVIFNKVDETTVVEEAEVFVDDLEKELIADEEPEELENEVVEGITSNTTTKKKTTKKAKIVTYKSYNVNGTIQIPKTNVKYPILDNMSPKALEKAVAIMYGVRT